VTAARGRARATGPAVGMAIRDGVAWLTLARPATRNALDAEVMAALADACQAVEHDDTVRVAVLGAAGADFCVGLLPGIAWPPAAWPDGIAAVAALTKPVLGCLAGSVRGWGLALALACDVRVAATTTVLELVCVPEGRLPGGGVTQRLTRIVGPSRALAMLLLAEPIAAREAVAWGLASRVTAPARLQAAAAEMARGLAARAPLALRLAKEAVIRALDLPMEDGVRLEHDLYVLLQTTADRTEGVRSFLERRAPRYQGR
jgi:enoyl-CoA hydratase/carnithine racemase